MSGQCQTHSVSEVYGFVHEPRTEDSLPKDWTYSFFRVHFAGQRASSRNHSPRPRPRDCACYESLNRLRLEVFKAY